MKIGVHLSGFTPDVGGGYTFQTDVFAAFIEMAGGRAEEFIILCDAPAIFALVQKLALPTNCRAVQMPTLRLSSRIARWLTLLVPQSRRFVAHWGRLQQAVIKEHVEFLWYVGGGAQELVDLPYIATVWDIQHRTHPWLPEVSKNGLWESREAAHATFLARAAYVITGTETGMRELELYYRIPRERMRMLPHPTPAFALHDSNNKVLDIRTRFDLSGDFFLYPAQLWPHKNHVNLLYALVELNRSYDYRPTLVLVGSDKGSKAFIQERATTLGLDTQLRFTGFIPVPELVALYREASGLVYVSMSGPENLPPLEAFALSCPVLVSDIPGAREQFGDSAIFVPPFDPAAIAEGWYRLKFDAALRAHLIESGRKRAENWIAQNYIMGVFEIFDEFKPMRRCWA